MTSTSYEQSSAPLDLARPSRDELAGENRHLRTALESRATVGQACGIIMAELHVEADIAFVYLRRWSMHENRKLVDIAGEIARTRQVSLSKGLGTRT